MARSIRVLEKHEKETREAWAGWREAVRKAREEGTAFATVYKNTELMALAAWREAEVDLKWAEFKVAAAKVLKFGEVNYMDCSRDEWEEMEEAAVEWKASKEGTFASEIETWEAREEALEALEALKVEQVDEAWNEFCTNYDLSTLCL